MINPETHDNAFSLNKRFGVSVLITKHSHTQLNLPRFIKTAHTRLKKSNGMIEFITGGRFVYLPDDCTLDWNYVNMDVESYASGVSKKKEVRRMIYTVRIGKVSVNTAKKLTKQ